VALLHQLVLNPGEEIRVQTLDALVPSSGTASEQTAVNSDALPADGMSFGLGDAGPVLDDRARAEYRSRLAELRREFEDAERCNDPGRMAAARAETEQLADELRAATGLGGRARRASSDVDRIRIAVTRRIRAAIDQLAKLHPALGDHLERSVRTGFTCCYMPLGHPDHSR
jgi:non-specific serine/threonine protein kinase